MKKKMTMRERMLAVIQGREHDQVPFAMYEIMFPPEQVFDHLGPDRIGIIRFCPVYRVEHPHCAFETRVWVEKGHKWQHTTLHTPKGVLTEKRQFEPTFDSSVAEKHFIETRQDYEILWSYLEDCMILENYQQYYRDCEELGEHGLPKPEIERTPWQQLWIEWVGLQALSIHLVDYPDHVERTIELLTQRARKMFEIAYRSPAPYIDIPDNITAPAIGPARFRKYCKALYDELGGMLSERGAPLFIHMDGLLKPLWSEIASSKVGGMDSFTPAPDCDTTTAEAVALWPDKRLWVNPPCSVFLKSPQEIRAAVEDILSAAGHTGNLQIQISENIPPQTWKTGFSMIADAIDQFGKP